jgi:hypothetical protein
LKDLPGFDLDTFRRLSGWDEGETIDSRPVVDGESLTGHGGRIGEYPEIHICSGQGPGGGALMCAIAAFHWANVKIRRNKVELWIEGKTRIVIEHAVVLYAPAPADEEVG